MVGAGPCTFAVWGYVIANCKNGSVEINPTILSAILGTTKEDVEKSIEYLSAPDPESRSKVLEGRRLVKVGAFFYEVPNHATYRAMTTDEERREYFREKKREQRERDAKNKELMEMSLTVKDKTSESNLSTQAEAGSDAYAEASKKSPKPPSERLRFQRKNKSSKNLPFIQNNPTKSESGIRTHVSSALNCIDRDFVEKEWESQGYGIPLSPRWKYKDLPAMFKAHLETKTK